MAHARLPLTALILTSLFFTGISFASTLPYRGIVAIEALGIDNSSYALLMTVGSVATAAASLALGYLSDRVGDRRLLVMFCALLGAVAHGLIYLFHTPLAYIVAYCVILPFGGALFSQSFSFSRAYYNQHRPDNAEFMMSVLRTIFAVAWVVVPPVAGWIASTFTVFDLYGVSAAAHVVCTLIFAFMLRDERTHIGTARGSTGQAVLEPAGRVEARTIIGIGGVTLINTAMVLNVTTIPLAILNNFGGTLADVGIVASLAAGLEVPCMLFWGLAAQRISKETILIFNAGLFGIYLLLLFSAGSVVDVLWLQGLNAIATAALLSITISYMQDAIKGRVGLSTSLLDVVTVVSALIASGIFAVWTNADSYVLVFLAGSILSIAGAMVILSSRLRLKRAAAA